MARERYPCAYAGECSLSSPDGECDGFGGLKHEKLGECMAYRECPDVDALDRIAEELQYIGSHCLNVDGSVVEGYAKKIRDAL